MAKIPEGKVVLFAYVKKQNKEYFEKQAEDFGGVSRALDLLLSNLRWKKRKLSVYISSKSKENQQETGVEDVTNTD